MFYIFDFFVVCSAASSMWVTEFLPKFFDISNSIIWIRLNYFGGDQKEQI